MNKIDWNKIQKTFKDFPYWVLTDHNFVAQHAKYPETYEQTRRKQAGFPEYYAADFGLNFTYPAVNFRHGNIVLSSNGQEEGIPDHRHYPTTDLMSVSVPIMLEERSFKPIFKFENEKYEVKEDRCFVFNSSKVNHEIICHDSHIMAFIVFEQVDPQDIPLIASFYNREIYEIDSKGQRSNEVVKYQDIKQLQRRELIDLADTSLSKLKYRGQPHYVSVFNPKDKRQDESFYQETNMSKYDIVPSRLIDVPNDLNYGAIIAMLSHNNKNSGLPAHMHQPVTEQNTYTVFRRINQGTKRASIKFYDYPVESYKGGFVSVGKRQPITELNPDQDFVLQFNSSKILHDMTCDPNGDIWLMVIIEASTDSLDVIKEKFNVSNHVII